MSEEIAITNVKVFDGNALTGECTVVIYYAFISPAKQLTGRRWAKDGSLPPHPVLMSTGCFELEHGTTARRFTVDMDLLVMALTESSTVIEKS